MTQSAEQYSLSKILLIWFAASAPMGLSFWVIGPALADEPFELMVITIVCLTLGLIWQFVLAMIILRQEEGEISIAAMSRRLWLRIPQDPKSDRPRLILFLWLIPVCAAWVGFGSYLSGPVNDAWNSVVNILPSASQSPEVLFSPDVKPRLEGAWWFFALMMTMSIFNVFLGEELLFHGILLPKMRGVFGRADWIANGVLFAFYHVHQPWTYGSNLIVATFLLALPARYFKSIWMSIIPHAIQTVHMFFLLNMLVLGA